MPRSLRRHRSTAAGARGFATTRWTVVLCAGDVGSPEARDALDQLCRTYWYPLYAYARRHGHASHDAQDLTQEFFARLLEKRCLQDVDRQKGRFRSFLLSALKHFLANEWDRRRAQKRGGGRVHVPIDGVSAEGFYAREAARSESPEKLFDRRWALALLDQVLARLSDEQAASGKSRQFDALKGCLTAGRGALRYAELAHGLGMTENALKVAVHRLRKRFRELLRAEIAHTVASEAEIDEEIRHLFAALES